MKGLVCKNVNLSKNDKWNVEPYSPIMDLSLLSRANLSFGLNSLNSLFVHLSYNITEIALEKIEMRLWLDARFDLLNVSPLAADIWSLRVVSAARPLFYTSFICKRKSKATSWDGYVFALLLRMRGSITENKRLMRNEEGDEAVLHWEIRRSSGNATQEHIHKVAVKFRVVPDSLYALVPVAKNTDLINTGVLSGQQSATSMRVFTASLGGVIRDVTARSHCISAESRVLKTSPTCTSVYVDGSELRGMQNMKVHVHYEKWTTFIGFTVWYPRLPVTLWLRDPVLNSISGWPITVWKNLKGERHHKGAAKQFACGNRFQQTELRVFASFQVSDERTGERMYLSSHRDIMFDVTSLAADSIVSADRSIATIRNYKNRVIVQAVQPGETRIVVKTQTPNIDFGSTTLVVSAETVTPTRLTALPVVEMNINIEPTAGKRAQYDLVTTLETTFQHRYQHGSFFYQLYYSDDSMEFLDDVTVTDFTLTSQSSDERVIALAHKVQNGIDMIALDDLSDPFIQLELRPPVHCTDAEAAPLLMLQVPLRVQFEGVDSSRLAVARFSINATTPTQAPEMTSLWRLDSTLAVILVVIIFGGVVKFFSKRASSFRGYEKLVAPLLSRLSSSSSGSGRDEDSKEWVWLGKARTDTNSIGSRYSQKSTIHVVEQSSPSYDENTQTSISYRGSEISVFISPTPVVTVHADYEPQCGGSWRSNGKARTRAARHALIDSSSDHNLARVVARTGSWREANAWPSNTWNSKKRATVYEGMRESVA
ncbi:Transmembrane protein [Trichostrongylus colubriformis]|uniref:Transmembrane protein n=1 Tax=Trichostrongylus colubriformis TaxID=6319 RepID=A0AAN8IK73_TRICO